MPLVDRADSALIAFFKKYHSHAARVALFVIFFWFGLLKVFGASPASLLVESLQQKTLPWIPFPTFIVCFGVYEMLVGLFFIIPRLERAALALLALHLLTTILPLVFLRGIAWQGLFVPTIEGQYILKNMLIIAAAMQVGATLSPLKSS